MIDDRIEKSEKIEDLIDLIRRTYFETYNIEGCTATIHFSSDNIDFHITFPMKWNFDKKITEDIKACPVMDLFSHVGVKNSKGVQILYVYSNTNDLYNSLSKFPEFIQMYGRSERGIKRFDL